MLARVAARRQSGSWMRQFSSRTASNKLDVRSPFDDRVVASVHVMDAKEVKASLAAAEKAQKEWQQVPLSQRIVHVEKFIEAIREDKSIPIEISNQMGKPIGQAENEVGGLAARTKAFIEQAAAALDSQVVQNTGAFRRRVVREPVGIVAAIAPWNYPLLTAGNVVVPAVLAGNAVVLKHSPRTPLCGDHFARAFDKAGVPAGLVQALFTDHATFASTVVPHPSVGFVSFTGSVRGGREVYSSVASKRFIDVGLELGGKDAMYVAEDGDLDSAVENAVDGACYNAGQSCCAIERVYVHASHYPKFLEKAAALVAAYKLGDPADRATNMGPLAMAETAKRLEATVAEAAKAGARVLAGGKRVKTGSRLTNFFEPTLVADCSAKMRLMQEENFGPVVAVQRVSSDAEAVEMANSTAFGLTSSLWTKSEARAWALAPQLHSGTVFMNRCDYLDPHLVWAGRGDSGKGAAMGHAGFHAVTRPKSIHFKLP